jgi:hypothetical protein
VFLTRKCSAGLTISNFSAKRIMYVDAGATVTMVGCSFTSNTLVSKSSSDGVLTVWGFGCDDKAASNHLLDDTIVRLQTCKFENSSGDAPIKTLDDSGVDYPNNASLVHIYSDNDIMVQGENDLGTPQLGVTEPLSAAPAGRPGISGTSNWLKLVQEVRPSSA